MKFNNRLLPSMAFCAVVGLATGCEMGEPPPSRGADATPIVDAPRDARASASDAGGGATDAANVDASSQVAAFYQLAYDPSATPRFGALDDMGRPVGELSPAALAVIASTRWEMVVRDGATEVILRGMASFTVAGANLAVADCGRLAATLAECAGEVRCWSGRASVPAGAPALRCRPNSEVPVCDELAPPTGLALSPWRLGVRIFEAGAATLYLRKAGIGVSLYVYDGASTRQVDLDLDGNVTEHPGTIDWRAALARARTDLATVSSWSYTRPMCPGWPHPIVEASCTAANDAFMACSSALVGEGSSGACFTALDAYIEPVRGPLDLRPYCVAR